MANFHQKIVNLIDRLHFWREGFFLRIIAWLTRKADSPVIGRFIRWLGNFYTRYLIYGKTLIGHSDLWPAHEHSDFLPHTVIDHESALRLIQREKDLCVINCMCRTIGKNCNAPLKTCILVGYQARIRNKKHPESRLTREQAVYLLQSCFEKNLIHNAIYALRHLVEICNCCKCCCVPILGVKQGFKSLRPSNYKALKSDDLCKLCGICETICPFEAIKDYKIDSNRCYGCGLCAYKCPERAIKMVLKYEVL